MTRKTGHFDELLEKLLEEIIMKGVTRTVLYGSKIMGYRAYVVKPGSMDEYTDGEYFNWREYEILVLLYNYNIRIDHDSYKHKTMWAIREAELNALIALLEASPNEIDECFLEGRREYTNQELANVFKDWVEHADQETGLVRIHWF